MVTTLLIVNNSTLITDEALKPIVWAIQRQVSEHLYPAWGVNASLVAAVKGDYPSSAKIFVVDASTDAGALGEHFWKGAPTGFAAVKDAQDDGVPPSSVISHEVLELLVDPEIIRLMQVGDVVVPLEVCDAVEGAPYSIDGVDVENFVLPSYYVAGATAPFDHEGVLKSGAPSLMPGGYCYSAPIGQWTQQNAERVRAAKRAPAPAWSRRGRRGARR